METRSWRGLPYPWQSHDFVNPRWEWRPVMCDGGGYACLCTPRIPLPFKSRVSCHGHDGLLDIIWEVRIVT